MTTTTLKIGQTISLKIKRLGINGEGIGYHRKTIIFVPGALPKEEISIKITQVAPTFAQGEVTKINKFSSERVTPRCPVYETCGGCQLQHLSYPAQLAFKKDLLKQALHKFKPQNYQNYPLLDTIGMSDPWEYRNKAQFQLRKLDGEIQAGLYQADSHRLVPIEHCLVQHPTTTHVMNTVVELLNKYQLPIYNEKKNSGIFRTIMVRVGIKTGQVQIVFITQSTKFPQKKAIIDEINQFLPEVVSIMQNVQQKRTSVVMGDDTIHLWGEKQITDSINEIQFDLSPRAFFQLNPKQTETMYNACLTALDMKKNETLVDAYCGVGTIGLSAAHLAKEVRGMDIIAESIEDAQKNAQRLGAFNTRYEVGSAEQLLPQWLKEGFSFDALIVDPPRTGLDQKLLQTLLKHPPKKMVYISCNISTLSKDLVILAKLFKVDYLQSIDMFPQTARCEIIIKLSRKK